MKVDSALVLLLDVQMKQQITITQMRLKMTEVVYMMVVQKVILLVVQIKI